MDFPTWTNKKFLWPSASTCHREVLCFFLPTATLCGGPLGFWFLSLNNSIYSRQQQQNQRGDAAVSLPVLLLSGQSCFFPMIAQCKRWEKYQEYKKFLLRKKQFLFPRCVTILHKHEQGTLNCGVCDNSLEAAVFSVGWRRVRLDVSLCILKYTGFCTPFTGALLS